MNVLTIAYTKIITGSSSKQLPARLLSKICLRLVQKISQYYDPLFSYQINDQSLQLPISHALPIVRQKYPNYSQNLARVANCTQSKYPNLKIIDIGANIGDSVFIVRGKVFCPILCIEGDPRFFKILQNNISGCENVVAQQAFVGDDDLTTNKKLVVVSGTAHFTDSDHIQTKFKKLSSILKNEPQFEQAKLLKIDTDGFDLTIIRGSVDFIQTARPVLFFEYDPFFFKHQQEDGISIFSLLQIWGYHSMIIYDNFGRYLISLPLTATSQIADMHGYLLNRQGNYYYDICAVCTEDLEIIQQLREIELFQQQPRALPASGERREECV